MNAPVTVITGANSGIGRATALHLAAKGHRVFATMRSLDKGEKLHALAEEAGVTVTPIVLDVVDDDQVAAGFQEIITQAGTIDVLVNNAGIGQNAAIEDVTVDAGKEVFDINVWGVVRCTQAALPPMRAQGSGHIVQISSIAGRIGIPGQPVYCASKWALEGMSENMAHDLAPHGIRVSLIEPGVTRTAILAKNPDAPTDSAYADAYARMFDVYATGVIANVRPEAVAETIEAALDAEPGQLRWGVAWGAAEMSGGRPFTDLELTELGALADDGPAWRQRFEDLYGLEIISAGLD
jgi:NAD(P)-dependent dehydrogenase (short-subunit alcohol dehydrogenase family)